MSFKARHIIVRILLAAANLSVGCGMVAAAWSGTVDAVVHPVVAIGTLTFPLWVPVMLLLVIFDVLWFKQLVVWGALVFGLSFPMVVRTFPVNIPRGDVPARLADSSWTLLTYNTAEFQIRWDATTDKDMNATIQYIIDRNPDVAVLQETDYIDEFEPFGITHKQVETLRNRYRFISIGRDITLLSKFEGERLDLDTYERARELTLDAHAGMFKLNIHGRTVLVVSVHLQSIGLTPSDKELYGDLTRGKGISADEEEAVHDELIDKLAAANSVRAEQARAIADIIESLDVDDVVVAGDFNDAPGCYADRLLERTGLRPVYPQVGCGYNMTYNADRFYFRIDHIFVRGSFRPWSIERGDLRSSDHYPQTVTFVESRN